MPQTSKAPTLVASRTALPPVGAHFASGRPGGETSALQVRSLAKASCTCTPRLLPISSCHSSTTTIFTLPSASRASARDSSTVRLSGVVTSTVGRRLFCALRSLAAVSPLRAPNVHGLNSPSACTALSASCNAPSVSAARARIGVSQITVRGAATTVALTAMLLIADCPGIVWRKAIKRIKIPSHTA